MEEIATLFFLIGGVLIGGAILLFKQQQRLRTFMICIAGFIGLSALTAPMVFYGMGEHRDWITIVSTSVTLGGAAVLAEIFKDGLKARRGT